MPRRVSRLGPFVIWIGLWFSACSDETEDVEPIVEDYACERGFAGPDCEPCEPGTFCPGGRADPIPCAPGTWDDDKDASTECLPWQNCRAGEFRESEGSALEDVSCPPCPRRTYNIHENAESCVDWTRCPPGTRAYDGTTTTDQKCEVCPEGTFGRWVDSPECVEWSTCWPGSYVVTEPSLENDRVCEFCALGTYNQGKNLPACEDWEHCQPGHYLVAEGYHRASPVCEPCPESTYSSGVDDTECLPVGECVAGEYLLSPVTNTGPARCGGCPPGSYCEGGEVPYERCPDGTWDHDGDGATPCLTWSDCAPGERAEDGTKTQDRTCWPCHPRHYAPINSPECLPFEECGAGTYLQGYDPGLGTLCPTCPPGMFSTANNVTQCAAKTVCAAGSYIVDEGDEISDRLCWSCPAGTYSDSTDSTSCSDWPTCPPGTYVFGRSHTAAGTCLPCENGTDTSYPNSEECVSNVVCAPGTRLDGGDCVACESGTYCAGRDQGPWLCEGEFWDHDSNPASPCQMRTNCPPGTFISAAGDDLNDRECSPCPAGEFSDTSNALSCSAWQTCGDNSYFKLPGNAQQDHDCAPCPFGMVSTGPNASECVRSGYRGVFVGPDASCAIRSKDSSLICWGEITPPELTFPIKKVVLSYSTVAVLKSAVSEVACFGTFCWNFPGDGYVGLEYNGQLCAHRSDGMVFCRYSNYNPTVPLDSFTVSSSQVCGIRSSDKHFQCWGSHGPQTSPLTHQAVLHIQADDPHCILRVDNKIVCNTSTPPTFDFESFEETCGIRTNGQVACWNHSSSSPVVPGSVTELSMKNGKVCVVRPDESIDCYGSRLLEISAPNDRQYLHAHRTCAIRADDLNVDCLMRFFGGGLRNWQTDPVLFGQKLIDFRLGDKLRCGIRFSDNKVICEGYPANSTPSNFHNWVSPDAYDVIDMSGNVVCGIRSSNGEVSCWGAGTTGLLTPPTGVSFDSISVGSFGCGVKSTDGSIACWGTTHTPPSGSFQQVSVGDDFACAITNGSSVVCFGNTPPGIPAATGVRALEISAFQDKLCAIRAVDQAVQCWGFEDPPIGQPGEILSSISTVYSGYCGLRNTGEYVCRGYRLVNPW